MSVTFTPRQGGSPGAATSGLSGRSLLEYLGRLLPDSAPRQADPVESEIARIAASGLFDELWFAEQHPEAALQPGGVIAWQVRTAPLLAPHPIFDVVHYVTRNPGWEASAASPLGHYVLAGAAAGATPHPLFDPAWYAAQAPGVPLTEAFRHYLSEGFAEGLSPHPAFDAAFYASQLPGLQAARINPLTHFVQLGAAQGLSPNRLFDAAWYAGRYPEVAERGVNLLVHYLTEGAATGAAPHPHLAAEPLDRFLARVTAGEAPPPAAPPPATLPPAALSALIAALPCPPPAAASAPAVDALEAEIARIAASGLFDELWFAEQQPEAAQHTGGVIAWQVRHAPLLAPHPIFDVVHYLTTTPGWQDSAATPLGHYLLEGAADGASPHPLFDPAWYAAQVPGIPAAEAFRHYLSEGFAEGLSPHPAFDPAHYASQVPSLRAGRINPLTHFVQLGWAQGLSPNRVFDVSWYAARHPGLAAQGLNPLVHFLTEGVLAGEAPHPGIDLADYLAQHPELPDAAAAYRHLLGEGAGWISDQALATARELAASRASAAATPPVPARAVLDLEDFTTDCDAADRLPQGRATPAPAPLLAAIAAARRVSFDIWDTLLRRDCHPDEIKLQSARLLKLRGQAYLRDQDTTPGRPVAAAAGGRGRGRPRRA